MRLSRENIIVLLSILILFLSMMQNTDDSNQIQEIHFIFPEGENNDDLTPSNLDAGRYSLASVAAYNNTNELRIFGNIQLASYATNGSGTEGDPYILEYYNVTSDGTNEALYLSGITAHTIIRNNIFDHQDRGNEAGFVFSSQNLVFENNTFMNSKVGLYFSQGSNNVIRDQNFVAIDGLSSRTIQFYRTTDSLIEDLDFTNAADKGIYLADANSITIKNTTITGANDGIEITRSGSGYGQHNIITNVTFDSMSSEGVIDWGYNNTISNSSFISTNTGITLFHSTNTTISNNTFTDMTQAVQLSTSGSSTSFHTIKNNVIANSTRGIYALNVNVQETSILNNTIENNNYGIDWDTTSVGKNNLIKFNIFTNNSYSMSFGDYTGMNATENFIKHCRSLGVQILGSDNLWLKNNTIYNSSSYGLFISSTSVINGAEVMYNDFIGNGGTSSQVIAFSGSHIVEKNYYDDHTNIDGDSNGISDSAYDFDNGGTYLDATPLVNFSSPFTGVFALSPAITVSNSSTVIIELGSTGNVLYWEIADENPDVYTVTKDGSPVSGHDGQPWISGQSITVSIDGLSLGTTEYQASFSDTWSNEQISTITVIVQDSTAPSVSYNIVDFSTYSIGELTTFTWTATDEAPSNYSLSLNNDLQIDEQPWTSGTEYNFGISGLEAGLHNITLQLRDDGNNMMTRYIYFFIVDDVSPIIQEQPASTIQYPDNATNYIVTYNATDNYNASHYQIWVDDVQQGGNFTWTNATDVVIDLVSYMSTQGSYNFTIFFFDDAGLSTSHQIDVTVVDPNPPNLTNRVYPVNNEIIEGDDTKYINWTFTDSNPDTYVVYLESAVFTLGAWTSGESIQVYLTDLIFGQYNYTIVVSDTSGNDIPDTIIITVLDVIVPVIESFSDQTVEFGESTEVSWNITETYMDYYDLYFDGVLLTSKALTANVSTPLTPDSVGIFNFTLVAYDQAGNSAVSTILVTVVDTIAPTITQPADISYQEGETENIISWTVTDMNSGNYSVSIDGVEVATDSWLPETPFSVNVDGLTVGTRTVEITVTDMGGNSVTDTVIVTVEPAPTSQETTSTSTTSSSSPSTQTNTSSTTTTLPSSSITGDSPLFMLSLFLLTGMILRNRRKYD